MMMYDHVSLCAEHTVTEFLMVCWVKVLDLVRMETAWHFYEDGLASIFIKPLW